MKPLYRSIISLTALALAVLCTLNVAALWVLVAIGADGNRAVPVAIARRAYWVTDAGIGLSVLVGPAVVFIFSLFWYPFARRRGSERDIAYSGWALVLTCLCLIFAWSGLSGLTGCRSGPRISSKTNLKQIGLGVLMYQNDYEDRMPPDLQTLHEEGYAKDANLFRDPLARAKGFDEKRIDATGDYVWSPMAISYEMKGYAYSSGVPIAWEKRTTRRYNGVNVLFADAHVEYIPPGVLKALTESAADVYKKPPVLPETVEK